MGMAASQARLLCITARIHDVEYQAQSIQNAKMQLANLSDKAYQEYNAALDATTLTITAINVDNGEKSTVPATFNNLCSRNRLTPSTGGEYAIRNKEGKLLVEDEIEEGYYSFKNLGLDDPFQFAAYMCGIENTANNFDKKDLENAELGVFNNLTEDKKTDLLKKSYEKLCNLTGNDIFNRDKVSKESLEEYDDALACFRKELYRSNTAEIINETTGAARGEITSEDIDSSLFNYYVSIYNQIKACGGCASIEEYEGDPANNSEWLQNMIQSGMFTIEMVETDRKTGKVIMDGTSPSSDSSLSYTTTTTIDKRALAKAEAEYEHTLKQIDKKDQMFDLELSKLETERTALKTEYESVKKVIEENIDRTFGIFS